MKSRLMLTMLVICLVTVFANICVHSETLEESNEIDKGENIAMELYVSYTSGTDENTGLTAESPLKTLRAAQEKARAFQGDGDVVINLMEGTHFLEETLALTTADSGKGDNRVIYRNAPGASPIVSGGVEIQNWTLHDPIKGIYKAKVPEGLNFRQLYVDGQKAIRARSTVEEYQDMIVRVDIENREVVFQRSQVEKFADQMDGVEIIVLDDWTNLLMRIDSVRMDDFYAYASLKWPESGIAFTRPSPVFAQVHYLPNRNYHFENAYGFIDRPGEWYLDTKDSTLYYMPQPYEDMETAQVIAPKLENMITLIGDDYGSPVRNITFQGLRFMHSNWLGPSQTGAMFSQALEYNYDPEYTGDSVNYTGLISARRPLAGVYLHVTDGIVFEDNSFTCMGGVGLDLHRGTRHTLVKGNVFEEISGTAIMDSVLADEGADSTDYPPLFREEERAINRYDVICDNYIGHVSTDYIGGPGITVGWGEYLEISHNEICDLPYTGISLGWTWADPGHGDGHNKVNYNYIHDVMQMCYDGGAIYGLGRSYGSEMKGNYIQNVIHEFAATYFDSFSFGYTVTENVIENVPMLIHIANHGDFWLKYDNNYSTTAATTLMDLPYAKVTNLTVRPNADWPYAARQIIAAAGLPREYKDRISPIHEINGSRSVHAGDTAEFSLVTRDRNIEKIQWQKYINGAWTDLPGEVRAKLRINVRYADNNASYRCKVTSDGTDYFSKPLTLLVSVSKINSQLASWSFNSQLFYKNSTMAKYDLNVEGNLAFDSLGINGRAVQVDGSVKIYANNWNELAENSSRTAAFWIKTVDETGNFVGWGGAENGFRTGLNDGKAYVTSGKTTLTAPQPLNDGKWHFLAFTYDGVNGAIYIDGQKACQEEMAVDTTRTSLDILSGFDGSMDEINLYSEALSEQEVRNLYDQVLQARRPRIIADLSGGNIQAEYGAPLEMKAEFAAVSGQPLAYQWQKSSDGETWEDVADQTQDVFYDPQANQESHRKYFRVKSYIADFDAEVCSVYSRPVYVEMPLTEAQLAIVPEITKQPEDQKILAGDTLVLTAETAPAPDGAATAWQWQRKNQETDQWEAVPGGDKAALQIENMELGTRQDWFRCIVTNSRGGDSMFVISRIAHVEINDMVLHLTFDDENNLWEDSSIHHRKVTSERLPDLVEGVEGSALSYDFEYIEDPRKYGIISQEDWGILTGNAPRSVSLWLKSTSNAAVLKWGNFAVSGALAGPYGLGIETGGNGHYNYHRNEKSGDWNHYVITYDGVTAVIYTNGVTTPADADVRAVNTAKASFQIGSYQFDGQLDDVRIYDYALTPEEVQTLYHMGDNREK